MQSILSIDSKRHTLESLRLFGGFLSPIPRARLRISGADRTRYLNAQLSNDLRKTSPSEALPCCLLTAKGKLCALVWVFEEGDSWIVDADFRIRDSLRNRLERYIVADDVQVDDSSDEGVLFHFFGKAASGKIAGISVSRLGLPGIDVWIPRAQSEAYHEKLIQAPILEAVPEFSELLRIEQGIPTWQQEISEESFPAEAFLDRYAVDFAKGCYVGQEIVSRIRSVGRVNRHLVGLITETPDGILIPGSKILDRSSGVSIGTVTSAAFHFELSRFIALGYIKAGAGPSAGELLLVIHPENGLEVRARFRQFPLTTFSET